MKGLNDPARPVRVKAGNALGLLSQIHVRIDPIFVELLNGLKTNDEASFKYETLFFSILNLIELTFSSSRETYLLALKNCLTAVASKVSDEVKKQIEQALVSCQSNENDLVRQLSLNCKEILLSTH